MPRTVKMQAVLAEPAEERKFWTMKADPVWEDFSGTEYFYDGEVQVVNGRTNVPVDQSIWVRRLLMSNYTFDPAEQEAEFKARYPEA